MHQIGMGPPTTSGQATTWIADVTVKCPDSITFAMVAQRRGERKPVRTLLRDADTVYVTDDRTPGGNGGVLKFGARYGLDAALVRPDDLPLPAEYRTSGLSTRPSRPWPRVPMARETWRFSSSRLKNKGRSRSLSKTGPMRVVDTGCPGGGLQPNGSLLPCPETFTTVQTVPTGTDFRGVASRRGCVGAECIGQRCIPGGGCQDATQAGCGSALRHVARSGHNLAATQTCPITCSVPFADADLDGDVDLDDFGAFQRCYTGVGGTATGQCKCYDRPEESFPNGDGDVDQTDFNVFVGGATRAVLPPISIAAAEKA